MDRRDALRAVGLGAVAFGAGGSGIRAFATLAQGEWAGYKDGQFVLPDLPYSYDALEPHLDGETMRIHHGAHHAAYVRGANAAMSALREVREGSRPAAETKHWTGQLAFHGSGHVLHALYWESMSPESSEPSVELARLIQRDFGGMEPFRTQLTAAAFTVEGSGWGILGYHPLSAGLMIAQIEKHQNLAIQGLVPILVVDVWEHAYYLKYRNKRDDFIAAWWNVVNWAGASERLAAAIA